MRFNKPLILPVVWNTNESTKAEELGIDYDIDYDDLDTRNCRFYSVDVLAPRENNNRLDQYTTIICGVESFIIRMGVHELERKIELHGNNIQGD